MCACVHVCVSLLETSADSLILCVCTYVVCALCEIHIHVGLAALRPWNSGKDKVTNTQFVENIM